MSDLPQSPDYLAWTFDPAHTNTGNATTTTVIDGRSYPVVLPDGSPIKPGFIYAGSIEGDKFVVERQGNRKERRAASARSRHLPGTATRITVTT